jgi:hypothetical protein
MILECLTDEKKYFKTYPNEISFLINFFYNISEFLIRSAIRLP